MTTYSKAERVRWARNPTGVAITGASSGIGAALAREYAAPDRRLILVGRDTCRLAAVANDCRENGAEVLCSHLDLRDADAIRSVLEKAEASGPLDLVIANAGVSSGTGPGGEPESWVDARLTISMNIDCTFNTLAPAIDLMRARGHGQIAVVGSLAAWRGLPFSPAYSASKAAIEAHAEGLRGLLAGSGIDITVISPGYVVSPMSARVHGRKPLEISSEQAARLIRRGLGRRRPRIAFPWRLALGIRLLSLLPSRLGDRMLLPFTTSVTPVLSTSEISDMTMPKTR